MIKVSWNNIYVKKLFIYILFFIWGVEYLRVKCRKLRRFSLFCYMVGSEEGVCVCMWFGLFLCVIRGIRNI